mgnify:CR=1 FL=1
MNFSHLDNKLRGKITRFSGILSQDLDITAQRFIRVAVHGIIASHSVVLTEIGRRLESTNQLIGLQIASNEISPLYMSLYFQGYIKVKQSKPYGYFIHVSCYFGKVL